MRIAKGKETSLKGCFLYSPFYLDTLEKSKLETIKEISGFQGCGVLTKEGAEELKCGILTDVSL